MMAGKPASPDKTIAAGATAAVKPSVEQQSQKGGPLGKSGNRPVKNPKAKPGR
jgi:hypothetical protein